MVLRQFVRPGDATIDATCGNGNDTLLLAGLVGASGKVWAFDIQEDAIETTARRLTEAGNAGLVELILGGHETMAQHVTVPVGAVVFNLGYLPGGDRAVVTHAETTISALDQAAKLLKPGGILAVTVYPGHDGGAREHLAVDDWATRCDQRAFHAWRMGQLNVPATAPYFIMVQKSA